MAFLTSLMGFGARVAFEDASIPAGSQGDLPDASAPNNTTLEQLIKEQFSRVVERTKESPPAELEEAIGNEKSHLEKNIYRFGLVSLISTKAFGEFDERFIKNVLNSSERTDSLWDAYYPRFKDAYDSHHPQDPGVSPPFFYTAKRAYHQLCSQYLIGTFEGFAKDASKTLAKNIIDPVDQTLRQDRLDLEPYMSKALDVLNNHYRHYNTGLDSKQERDERKIYRDFSKKLVDFLPEIAPFRILRQSSYLLLKIVGYLLFWLDIPAAYTIRLVLKYLLLPYWILPKTVESILELHERTPSLLADSLLKVVSDQLISLLAADNTIDAVEDEGTVFAFSEAPWKPETAHKLRALVNNVQPLSDLSAPEVENSLKLITKKMLQYGLLTSLKSINTALRTTSPHSQVDRDTLISRISRILASLAKEKTQETIYQSLIENLGGKATLNTNARIDAIHTELIEKLQKLPEKNPKHYTDEALKWYLAELLLIDLKTLDKESIERVNFCVTSLLNALEHGEINDGIREFLESSQKMASDTPINHDDNDATNPCDARDEATNSLSRRISRGVGYQNNGGIFGGRVHALSGTIARMAIETLDNSAGLVSAVTEEFSQRKLKALESELMNKEHTRSLIFSAMSVLSR